MAKYANPLVMDAALDKIATGTSLCVCTTQPTTRAEAITTYNLATATVSGASFTKSAGTGTGRKVTVAQQSNMSIANSGTALHVAIVDASALLYVTTCTSQALTAGGTVTVPAWNVEFAGPT
jgi:hypothetical protein